MRKEISLVALLFAALPAFAATVGEQPATNDAVIDHAIVQENALLAKLRTVTPVVETYIQELKNDSDFGTIPIKDHYYLGKIDLSRGLTETSYLPKSDDGPSGLNLFARFLTIQYLPKGFAQMMLIDGGAFDREHYQFQFLRREFIGDVRTLVYAVEPMKGDGPGHFVGNIWVEDKGDNIVRFNGTYSGSSGAHLYMHFDSWRINAGPDLWLPFESYSEEEHLTDAMSIHKSHFKAITKFWGYGGSEGREGSEMTSLTVQADDQVKDDQVKDETPEDPSPVESLRQWQRLAEDNILDRLERAGLIAKRGGIDKVLDTVINNVAVTNKLNLVPEVRARVLLTTPLETFTVGRTIVISRGMLDTLPNEAALAAILTHELAHIALGQTTSTDFAFSDRTRFDDARIMTRFKLARTPVEEEAANQKAVELLQNSPYKDQLGDAGLYLKAVFTESNLLPALNRPLLGDRLIENHNMVRLAGLMDSAPQLQTTHIDQLAALPLGSRTKLNPWTDDLEMITMRPVPLESAREKMPFELTPVYLHLTYEDSRRPDQVASNGN